MHTKGPGCAVYNFIIQHYFLIHYFMLKLGLERISVMFILNQFCWLFIDCWLPHFSPMLYLTYWYSIQWISVEQQMRARESLIMFALYFDRVLIGMWSMGRGFVLK